MDNKHLLLYYFNSLSIPDILDTTPLVMVVGGYSDQKEVLDPNTRRCYKDEDTGKCVLTKGLINDVEMLSFSREKNFCSKFVSPVHGYVQLSGEDEDGRVTFIDEADTRGSTGVFSKGAAIVCGGQMEWGDSNVCYEWDSKINR